MFDKIRRLSLVGLLALLPIGPAWADDADSESESEDAIPDFDAQTPMRPTRGGGPATFVAPGAFNTDLFEVGTKRATITVTECTTLEIVAKRSEGGAQAYVTVARQRGAAPSDGHETLRKYYIRGTSSTLRLPPLLPGRYKISLGVIKGKAHVEGSTRLMQSSSCKL